MQTGEVLPADYGGAVYVTQSSTAAVTNSILWANQAHIAGPQIALTSAGAIDVQYSDVQGGQANVWCDSCGPIGWQFNIDTDPLFVSLFTGNYELTAGSPCRDAGNDALYNANVFDLADLDGDLNIAEPTPYELSDFNGLYETRFVGPIDMGAYEYTP